jgi:thymidylate synthase
VLIEGMTVGRAWQRLLHLLYVSPRVSPRNHPCREQIDVTMRVHNPRYNIFINEHRRLNYRFMVAEWLWMWFGHEDVRSISQYNPNIAQFSDDGIVFDGAYGPRIRAQWDYCLRKLQEDEFTRQAVLYIYHMPEFPTKDVSCTLSLQFLLRHYELHLIVNMRSSDVWLGIPYDAFNFTMLQNIMAAQLNARVGTFTMHLGSSHLYEVNVEKAALVLDAGEGAVADVLSPKLPGTPPLQLNTILETKSGQLGCWPWTHYAEALCAPTSHEAMTCLMEVANAPQQG